MASAQEGFDIVGRIRRMASCMEQPQGPQEKLAISRGYKREHKPILARDIKAHGAMAALLKDALAPNLVQTLENNPAFIHGGPFANIAHGCNSVMATRTALKLADYVVTEAGFGADLGAEKFVDIKCRKGGFKPDAAVIVARFRDQVSRRVEVRISPGNLRRPAGIANLDALDKCRRLVLPAWSRSTPRRDSETECGGSRARTQPGSTRSSHTLTPQAARARSKFHRKSSGSATRQDFRVRYDEKKHLER